MAADSYTALVEEIEASRAEAKGADVDVTRVSRLALRDGAIALAALSIWAAADAWYATTGLTAAALLSALERSRRGLRARPARARVGSLRRRALGRRDRADHEVHAALPDLPARHAAQPGARVQGDERRRQRRALEPGRAVPALGAARCARARRARLRGVRVCVRRQHHRVSGDRALVRGGIAGRELRGAHRREAAPQSLDRLRRGRGAIRGARVPKAGSAVGFARSALRRARRSDRVCPADLQRREALAALARAHEPRDLGDFLRHRRLPPALEC